MHPGYRRRPRLSIRLGRLTPSPHGVVRFSVDGAGRPSLQLPWTGTEEATVTELEHLIASRMFLTAMLTAIGIAIAFGPEIRLAVARIRHVEPEEPELPAARAGAR
jgi:hypothetical protein